MGFALDGKESILGPGQMAYVPADRAHTFWNAQPDTTFHGKVSFASFSYKIVPLTTAWAMEDIMQAAMHAISFGSQVAQPVCNSPLSAYRVLGLRMLSRPWQVYLRH